MITEFNTISAILNDSASKHNNLYAFSWKQNGFWHSMTYGELKSNANRLSIELIRLGVKKGDKVVIISQNRPEFNIVDFACLQIGAISVALFPNYSAELIEELTRHCDAKIAFCENRFLELVKTISDDPTSTLSGHFCMEKTDAFSSLHRVLENENVDGNDQENLEKRIANVQPEDSAMIFYSSGTSDHPNGAVLDHRSYSMTIKNCHSIFGLQPGEKVLSYLPSCHAYERAHHYFYLTCGLHVHFAESPQDMVSNAQEVKPVMFTTVPMFLEKVLEVIRINAKMVKTPHQPDYLAAMEFAQNQSPSEAEQFRETEKHSTLEKSFFSNWRGVLGGSIKLVSCAGAPLPTHVGQFYYSIGIPILCCYGLSEIAGVAYQRLEELPNYNETGTLLDGIEAKLATDGELLLKSEQCMKEYYKNPDLTAKVIDKDGWFHTGDVCEITKNNGLKIVGRLRHMFKLPSGEYVSPEHIETILVRSQFISNIFVYSNKGCLSALIVPNDYFLNIHGTEKTRDLIKEDINIIYNSKVHSLQRVIDFDLVADNWSPDTGELTPTMKIKRHIIREKYRTIINL
ncbi:MAG: AMP-binding protein [Flavobacteriales bacterium]|nr:AMP-binding protein [Flavobacteriales bacterium]